MDDKTGISWSDPGWPYGDLNRSTALLYFEFSPFFDPSSNNAEARARGLDPANEHVLRSMPIDRPEYVVAEAQEPHLFVIRRQARLRDGTLQHQAYFYILYMTIYQAPTLHAVVTSRLRRCMFNLRQGLERVRRDLAPLPKLLLEQERKAEQQQQAAALAKESTPAEAGPAREAGVAAAVGEAQPVAMPEVLSREEKEYWERSDNIIMRTLQRYPMPQVPGTPAHQQQQQQQQQQQEGAFRGTAPKEERGQPKEEHKQPHAAAPMAAGPPAAAAAPEGPAPGTVAAAPVPAPKAKRARDAGRAALDASGRSRSKTPPPLPAAPGPLPPAAAGPAAVGGAAAAGGAADMAAPATSQGDSGAAGGDTSSAQQGTTASGSTAAASRAGPMKKVRLKLKGVGSKPPSPALGQLGSQGQPSPADGPTAKRARR